MENKRLKRILNGLKRNGYYWDEPSRTKFWSYDSMREIVNDSSDVRSYENFRHSTIVGTESQLKELKSNSDIDFNIMLISAL